MKHLVRFFAVLTVLFVAGSATAQNIVVQSALGQRLDSFLFKNMLGDGVYIYNAKYAATHDTIHIPNIGSFNANGYSGLSMDKGVVMTTGNVDVAPGPNDSGSKTNQTNPWYCDSTMNVWLQENQHVTCCSTIDFDFICASGSIQLLYMFGSEEYWEYVGASVNDVFGFIVSGEHPLTGQDSTWNIAIIPNSVDSTHPNGVAVSINTVNDTSQWSQYYQIIQPRGNSTPTNTPGTQYDGLTTKLTAQTAINPCEPYHLHISICNVGDKAWDSGVFFEKGCLYSPMGAPGLTRYRPDTIRKACPISIPLSLANSAFETVNSKVKFQGSAINGQDFICKFNGTVLNSGDQITLTTDTSYLTFQSLVNSNNPKSIVLSFETGICANYSEVCSHDTMRFVMYGESHFKVKEKTISAPKVVTYVSAEVENGSGYLNYQWVPGDDILFPFLQSSPADIWTTRDYQVIAYDNQRCYFDTGTVHIVITGNGGGDDGIENADNDGISVYPNPVDNQLHISADQIQHIELYNIMGSKVYDAAVNTNQTDIETSALAPGTYALRITTPNGVFVRKVIKQ